MDINPFESVSTQYKTKPPTSSVNTTSAGSRSVTTTPVYRQRPATMGQMGRATSYISTGDSFTSSIKPHYYQLAAWDEARRNEPIIKEGINMISLSLINKIGSYVHPNSQISDFVNANLVDIKKWISDLIVSAYWSGFAVSEIIWERREGPNNIPQIWIQDIVNYHPSQVTFNLNLHGRLTHGEDLPTSNLKTGIWVPKPPSQVAYKTKSKKNDNGNLIRLSRSKVIHTTFGGEGNNPYGTSQIIPILKYHLFKEAFTDMMAVALDRYGTPLIYAVVPPHSTGEVVTEPDGSTRAKAYREVVAEALQDLRSETAVVFEQINKDHPVTLDTLTTGNNYAEAFKSAIDLCDQNMMVGMGIPNLIMRDERSGLGNGKSSENQLELFHNFISAMYDIIVGDFCKYAIRQLIAYNFDPASVKDANDPGEIKKIPFRFADVATITNSIVSLTETGYINPADQEDFDHVRSLVNMPHRKIDAVAKAGAGRIIEQGRPQPQAEGTVQPGSPSADGKDDHPFAKKQVNKRQEDPNKVLVAQSQVEKSKVDVEKAKIDVEKAKVDIQKQKEINKRPVSTTNNTSKSKPKPKVK